VLTGTGEKGNYHYDNLQNLALIGRKIVLGGEGERKGALNIPVEGKGVHLRVIETSAE